MTSQLPLPVSCLTLSHILDDVDAVEGYLSQDPSAADCMPIILRDIFFMNKDNEKYDISLSNHIPDAATTLRYLTALWDGHGNNILTVQLAAKYDAAYLIPYFDPLIVSEINDQESLNMYVIKSGQAFLDASKYDNNETIRALLRIPGRWGFGQIYDIVAAYTNAIIGGHLKTLEEIFYTVNPHRFSTALDLAAAKGNIAAMEVIVNSEPTFFTDDVMIDAILAARRSKHYAAAAWLASYPSYGTG